MQNSQLHSGTGSGFLSTGSGVSSSDIVDLRFPVQYHGFIPRQQIHGSLPTLLLRTPALHIIKSSERSLT